MGCPELGGKPLRAFPPGFAVCCAHNLPANGRQIPHLQPEMCFRPRTRRGRKRFYLYSPLSRRTLRGFGNGLRASRLGCPLLLEITACSTEPGEPCGVGLLPDLQSRTVSGDPPKRSRLIPSHRTGHAQRFWTYAKSSGSNRQRVLPVSSSCSCRCSRSRRCCSREPHCRSHRRSCRTGAAG